MSGLSTHVLDTSAGRPAAGVAVRLEIQEAGGEYREAGRGVTDDDGRAGALLGEGGALRAATYRLTFETGEYFAARGIETFYPQASIVFSVRQPTEHHHVPLLLAPWGYSTYRGS